MLRNEKETREQLIDPKLRQAGWEIATQKHTIEKNKACIETPVKNMPISSVNRNGNGFVDYTLFGDDGLPLAVVEAKKSVVNEEQGRVQACLYADALELQYGIRPVIYYTNGYDIKVIDGMYPARKVFGFHKKEELEYIIQKRNFVLSDTAPNSQICGRYYQMDAISEIIKHLQDKHSRSLIVLATGTGKTRTACGLSEIFIKNNFVKRILFLADRKNLVKQAKEETFDKYLPNIPSALIIEGNRTGLKDARIVFSTYNSMLSIINDVSKNPLGIGHFDLIIVDEAHRSLFHKYAEIFDYFDCLMVGLTATPRNDIHKSTFKVFNLDTDMPNYEYDLVKAVKDGYLTYFRALDRTPELLRNGATYENLPEDEKEQYEDLFMEEDGEIPEHVDGNAFWSTVMNKDTIRAVLKELMHEGLYVDNGNVLGKTIIFARNHKHAVEIQNVFREMYPELCDPNAYGGTDYCVIIDNQERYNEKLQREFKSTQKIRIVISVDMMDTGVDIPEVVNLVFFKKVLSKIKFWQMIGRGTRLCPNLKVVSPSKAYFERQTNDASRQLYEDKQGFLIFDVCNAFNFFNLNPDGKKDTSDHVLSLNQQIFVEKVMLLKNMQYKYAALSDEDKVFYENLLTEIVEEISSLNRNFIGVQNNLEHIEHYSLRENLLDLSQQDFVNIKNYIAPNIIGELELETMKKLDFFAYKFSSTKLVNDKHFAPIAYILYSLSNYFLEKKSHIAEVRNKEKILQFMCTDDFLTTTSVSQMESIRKEVREIMKYVDPNEVELPISDFRDIIVSNRDADFSNVDFSISIEDFKTYKEKLLFYISENKNIPLISKIIHFLPYTPDDVSQVKNAFMKISPDMDDYFSMFGLDDEEIVSFIRENIEIDETALNDFLSSQRNLGRTDDQIDFIKQLILFIYENGRFDRQYLTRPELNFLNYFNSVEIQEVIKAIEEVV